MTQDEIIELARQAGLMADGEMWFSPTYGSGDVHISHLEAFARLVAAKEREAILQMFEHAPALVDFAKNDQGGCLICGFTPEIAIKSIRARGGEA